MLIVHLYPSNILELVQYASLLTDLTDEEVVTTDNQKAFQQICTDRMPDIVHVHGCSQEMVKSAEWARKKGARIVITPHGQLESWELGNSAKLLSGLKNLVSRTYCLIARSEIEAAELRALGWNERIEVVRNPILTGTASKEELLKQHHRIYQKVMDSYVLELMDDYTLHALQVLLKVGITGDDRWGEPIEKEAVNWHHLLIYAQLEGIMTFVERGCSCMRIPLPDKPVASCYLPNHYVAPISLAGKHFSDIFTSIVNQVSTESLSLLSLAELDQALRREDIEDDVIMQQMEIERKSSFFAALLTVLNEQTGLDEGFMPCTPADNDETNRIRTSIKKHLEI